MSPAQRTTTSSLPAAIIRIALVVLAIAMLKLAPQASGLTEGLQAAEQALDDRAPRTALRHLEWVLLHEPWRGPDLWRMVGRTALEAGDIQAARTALLWLEEYEQVIPEDWLALGEANWQQGQFADALVSWQKAVNATTGDVEADSPGVRAAQRIVDYYRASGAYADEIQALRQLILLHPERADYFRLGLLLVVDAPEAAAAVFEEAVSIESNESDAQISEPASRLAAGLRMALLFDEPAYVKLQCGRLLGAEGYWDFAYRAFYEAVQMRPDVAEGWAYLAEASQQISMQDNQGAADTNLVRRWLEQAYRLSPENLAVNAFLGLYWLRQDGPEQAIPFLQQAAQLDAANPLWHQAIGAALAATGNVFEAQAAYRRGVEIAPGDPDAWRVLAEFHLHYEIQLETEGLVAAQRAVMLDPDNPANQDAVGLTLLLLGRRIEAAAYFQAALALNPDYAPALLHLGGLYLDGGQTAEAEALLGRAYALVGDHPELSLVAADVRRLQVWLNQGIVFPKEP